MKIEQMLIEYVNRNNEPRILGRYWATDIWGILKGYITPTNFFEAKKIDLQGAKYCLTGSAFENMLNQIFTELNIDYEYQVKKEYQVNDEITLVARPDFVFPEFILETKFPFSLIKNDEIPLRYCYQLESYYRIFAYKEVYLGVLSIPFNLNIIPYTPSKYRWKQILRALENFHQALKVELNKIKT